MASHRGKELQPQTDKKRVPVNDGRSRLPAAEDIISPAHLTHCGVAATWAADSSSSHSETEPSFTQNSEYGLPRQTEPVGSLDPSFVISSFVHQDEDTRGLSLNVALNLDAGPSGYEPTDTSKVPCQFEPTRLSDDPIGKGILSIPAAHNLFDW